MPNVLLLIPPLTQLNTPYPSTAYLTGFLRSQGVLCEQADLGIEMVLRVFSREGLRQVFYQLKPRRRSLHPVAQEMIANQTAILDHIDAVVAYLQGKAPELTKSFARRAFLPEGPRFRMQRSWSRSTSTEDRAKHAATLFLEDLTDLVQGTITPHFALNRYAEHIARSAASFDSMLAALQAAPALTDQFMLEALWAHVERVNPLLVGLSVPFPGNLYGAFRIAQSLKQNRPDILIALGGGYVNTELRRLSDVRVFDFVDYVTLDDGERPLLCLLEHLSGKRPVQALSRTYYRDNSRVVFADDVTLGNIAMNDAGCPTYRGLMLDRYLSILDSTNPMHRLWSEGHWNKLTVAHGCYWKQCTFCDVGLDYINRYEITPTERLIHNIQQLADETKRLAFHFVDEAAPPMALKALAIALLQRKIGISWWGNIRFEEAFTPDLCRLLAASGCIAVTAGLEAASDRLLAKMKKGITVDQTARVAAAFRQAGILVHAYLMYGFPSETVQETIDSLERVRQLFAADLVQSAFWHRFTVTAHSPIGLDPRGNGLRIVGPEFGGFAENDLLHEDATGPTPEWIGAGLRRSMLNFLESRGLAMEVTKWFDHPTPRPRVSPTWISRALGKRIPDEEFAAERRCVWIGEQACVESGTGHIKLSIQGRRRALTATLPSRQASWLSELLNEALPRRDRYASYPSWRDAKLAFPGRATDFASFVRDPSWRRIRSAGLLLV
ncbi:MAG TPA: radical SAM protein [Nitrospira sp.]|nr:radical SAM protein [Nitrospira sp.]